MHISPERLIPPQVPINQSRNLARGHAPTIGLEAVPVEVVVPDLRGVVEQTLILAYEEKTRGGGIVFRELREICTINEESKLFLPSSASP